MNIGVWENCYEPVACAQCLKLQSAELLPILSNFYNQLGWVQNVLSDIR